MNHNLDQTGVYSNSDSPENVRSREIFQLVLAGVVALLSYGSMDIYWLTALGIGLVVYSISWYIESLGRGSAIIQVMLLIASFQWVLGPIIAYHFEGETEKYRMYVEEEVYMSFAVPAVIALLIGLRFVSARVDLISISKHIKNSGLESRYIFLLILMGLSVEFFVPFIPSTFLFVAYLVAQFKFIGLLYLIVMAHPLRWFYTIGVFVISLVSSAEQGLFHGLILWSALIFSYICIVMKLSRLGKLAVLSLGIILLVSLQVVKADYRELIASGISQNESKVSLLIDMMLGSVDYLNENRLDTEVSVGSLNSRLNQGWIISAVMNNVPKNIDFVEGETILLAFKDSFIPRFIMEKRKVWVTENFQRFTGLDIGQKTSMGISILGESYANFGLFGGVIFMFFWGVIIAIIMKIIVDISVFHPTIILWAPLIFLQMVKAETELVVVLNHGVKTSIVIAIFYLTAKKILGWRI